MEDLRKGSKDSEEVVDTGDLDDFLNDMDTLQVTRVENTETQKEEVTESEKNNEEAPKQEDAVEPKVESAEKEEIKEPENVEEEVNADLDDFLGDMEKLQVNKVDVTVESPKIQETQKTNETFQVVNETNNTEDNTFVKVDTTQDQNNTQKLEQSNLEASENVLQNSPEKQQNSTEKEQNTTENVVSNESAPIVEAKPTDQKPEGFKIESAWANIDPVGKSVTDIQKEILAKVFIMKEEGNKFYQKKSYKNAIECWTRGLKLFSDNPLKDNLVDDEDLKSRYHNMMKILLSNLGKTYMFIKDYPMAFSCLKNAVTKIETLDDEFKLSLGNIKVYINLATLYKLEKHPREAAKIVEQAKSLLLKFDQQQKLKPEYSANLAELQKLLKAIDKEIEELNKKEQKRTKMFETLLKEEKIATESNVNVSTPKEQEVANNDTLKETKKSESSDDWGHRYMLAPLLLGGAGVASYFGLGKLLAKNPELISNHHRMLLAMGTGVSVTGLIVPKDASMKLAFGSMLVGLGIYVAGKLVKS